MGRAFAGRRLRLSTLTWLRWLAIVGQTATVLLIGFWFDFPVPFGACFALIALSAWVNIALRIRFPASNRLEPKWATLILGYDVVQLAGLLYLTGGLENPFAFLIISPVLVSATTMQADKTFLLGFLAFVCATILVFFHEPLPWPPGQMLAIPLLYVGGLWSALVCSLAFMGFFAFRIAEETRQLSTALTATELVLQREQHLTALDGLAAAAAHELGTPLGTIALVVKELQRETEEDDPRSEDLKLLASQSARCRNILSKLTSLSTEPEEHLGMLPLSRLVEEVTAPHRDLGKKLSIERHGTIAEPVFRRNPGILYGIGNLLENAVDFANSEITIGTGWDENWAIVTIADDGPGFSPDVIDQLGEPYITTRRTKPEAPRSHHGGGLGLGFFIAKTLLERSGAQLTLRNRTVPQTGAVVSIAWPRTAPIIGGSSEEEEEMLYAAE
ncbi:ActS/PrrB/RegB family redox-sensitive histidine kinase [Afifella sp. IM 167]|uniref:ActS/PrrB/RegB family redox-sensitive histidine kinase n=1 Tax=Afifella sp. IM 167 TaxID=2033586 RepID=UPI001CCF1704|nr:ActS/PrrB/RegB family redox-sensitive histidine kinase [Afifella sp. IM 167]MBZ8133766.1 two-component sensor histidine kinase [Afifella sp. IM 167]